MAQERPLTARGARRKGGWARPSSAPPQRAKFNPYLAWHDQKSTPKIRETIPENDPYTAWFKEPVVIRPKSAKLKKSTKSSGPFGVVTEIRPPKRRVQTPYGVSMPNSAITSSFGFYVQDLNRSGRGPKAGKIRGGSSNLVGLELLDTKSAYSSNDSGSRIKPFLPGEKCWAPRPNDKIELSSSKEKKRNHIHGLNYDEPTSMQRKDQDYIIEEDDNDDDDDDNERLYEALIEYILPMRYTVTFTFDLGTTRDYDHDQLLKRHPDSQKYWKDVEQSSQISHRAQEDDDTPFYEGQKCYVIRDDNKAHEAVIQRVRTRVFGISYDQQPGVIYEIKENQVQRQKIAKRKPIVIDPNDQHFDYITSLQEILRKPRGEQRRQKLFDWHNNFRKTAELGVKTIIDDLSIDVQVRRIPPVDIKRCPTKFVHRGLLYEIASDTKLSTEPDVFMYGRSKPDVELAMRSLSNDLKAHNLYFKRFYTSRQSVTVPVHTTIDYFGYRVVVTPLLPLSSSKQLIYGSDDRGEHVLHSDRLFNKYMREAAKELHLCTHQILDAADELHELDSAGDVGGYRAQGQYYLRSLQRALPAESPVLSAHLTPIACAPFVRLLRPELLAFFKAKNDIFRFPRLSSDCYSSWGAVNPSYNKLCDQATRFLYSTRVQHLADFMLQIHYKDRLPSSYINRVISDIWMQLGKQEYDLAPNILKRIRTSYRQEFQFKAVDATRFWQNFDDSLGIKIPAWAKTEQGCTFNSFISSVSIGALFHRFGVSIRHIGQVRRCIMSRVMKAALSGQNNVTSATNQGHLSERTRKVEEEEEEGFSDNDSLWFAAEILESAQELSLRLLNEMVSRVLKKQLRRVLRKADTSLVHSARAELVSNFLTTYQWDKVIQDIIQDYGPDSLSIDERADELAPIYCVLSQAAKYALKANGIEINPRAALPVVHRRWVWLSPKDVENFVPESNTFDFIQQIEARHKLDLALRIRPQDVQSDPKVRQQFMRLITEAHDLSLRLIESNPSDQDLFDQYHVCLRVLSLMKEDQTSSSSREAQTTLYLEAKERAWDVGGDLTSSLRSSFGKGSPFSSRRRLGSRPSSPVRSPKGGNMNRPQTAAPSRRRRVSVSWNENNLEQFSSDRPKTSPSNIDRKYGQEEDRDASLKLIERVIKRTVDIGSNSIALTSDEILQLMLTAGLDACVYRAARENDRRTLEYLLAQSSARYATQLLQKAFQIAISQQQSEVVRILAAAGAEIETVNKNGLTPLLFAAAKCNPVLLKLLLRLGANFEVYDKTRQTPLLRAAACGMATHHIQEVNFFGLKTLSTIAPLAPVAGPTDQCQICFSDDEKLFERCSECLLDLCRGCSQKVHAHRILINHKRIRFAGTGGDDELVIDEDDSFQSVKALLRAGADMSAVDKHGRSALILAVLKGSLENVKQLLDHKCDPALSDNSNRSPLHHAVLQSNDPIVIALLEANADVNQTDIDEMSAIHFAAAKDEKSIPDISYEYDPPTASKTKSKTSRSSEEESSSDEEESDEEDSDEDEDNRLMENQKLRQVNATSTLQILIDYGAAIDATNINKFTAFLFAGAHGNIKTLALLKAIGARMYGGDEHGQSVLHWAAQHNQVEVIKWLITVAEAVDVDSPDIEGRTSLSHAVLNGQEDAVRILLEMKAEIMSEDALGMTPLHHNATTNNAIITKILLEAKAKPDIRDTKKRSPIVIAAEHGKQQVLVALANTMPKSIRHTDGNFHTPLALSIINGHHECTHALLLELKADPLEINQDGKFILMTAAETTFESSPDTVKLLLDVKANPDSVDSKGQTALHYVAEGTTKIHHRIMRTLLDGNCSVDARNKQGKTPLWLASSAATMALEKSHGADKKGMDTVRLLLRRKASPGLKDKNGQTPIAAARASAEYGDPVVHLLLLAASDSLGTDEPAPDSPRKATRRLMATDKKNNIPASVEEVKQNFFEEEMVDDRALARAQQALFLAVEQERQGLTRLLIETRANINAAPTPEYTQAALLMAASGGNAGIVRKLLEEGVDVDTLDRHGQTSLLRAAAQGHTEVVVALLNGKSSIHSCKPSDGLTALHLAARHAHWATCEALIEGGLDTFAEDEINGYTPLHYATLTGDTETLLTMLDCGADPMVRDKDGRNCLHLAAMSGFDYFIPIFQQAQVDIEVTDNMERTPLMLAAMYGNVNFVRSILVAGASITAGDRDGRTALQLCVLSEETNAFNVLVQYGANIDVRDKNGQTALLLAASRGQDSMVKYLLAARANPESSDAQGQTALQAAALSGDFFMIKLLLEGKADIAASDDHGRTAFMLAAMNNEVGMVQKFCEASGFGSKRVFDLEQRDITGLTAYALAAKQGHREILMKLHNYGADMQTRDDEGQTPFLRAVLDSQVDMVRFMLDLKADVQQTDKKANSALLLATRNRDTKMATALIHAGAKREVTDLTGVTPLLLATVNNDAPMVKCLIELKCNIEAGHANSHQTSLMIASAEGYTDVVQILISNGANINARDNENNTANHFARKNKRDQVLKLLKRARTIGHNKKR